MARPKKTEVEQVLQTVEDNLVNIEEIVLLEEKQYNNIPPFTWERNAFKLLNHVDYIFKEDGSIDWKKMIPKEFLVPNRSLFAQKGKEIPRTIEGLQDNEMLVLLSGWQYLSKIRGYSSLNYEVIESRLDYSVVKGTINWIGNYETNYDPVTFSAVGTASLQNTVSFAQFYLNEIASNRVFSRLVRFGLGIPIVGADEVSNQIQVSENVEESTPYPTPLSTLKRKLAEKNISFERMISLLSSTEPDAKNWKDFEDIPTSKLLAILGRIADKEKEKAKEIK